MKQALRFWKYHGLGNDYLVVLPNYRLTRQQIRQICHRQVGIGSDGILVPTDGGDSAEFGVTIYNPDGSEAEKSGNGLRIFTRYLFDTGQIDTAPVTISTLGGEVSAQRLSDQMVRVGMGKVHIEALDLPIWLEAHDATVHASVLSIGNPHCVLFEEGATLASVERRASLLGPQLERHSRFPNRTNVQFGKVLNRSAIYIAIWERGAGRTFASGSSSCAAAAVAYKLGYCDREVRVKMAGGELSVFIDRDDEVILEGMVTKVGEGEISAEIFTQPLPIIYKA